MATWTEFNAAAPTVSTLFERRHAAAGKLCMLGTTRADGSARISPMEPRIFEGHLVVLGMPATQKFKDLARDPRFCIHTATIDPNVGDGDVKLFGRVRNLQDPDMHGRFSELLFEEIGLDLRGQTFDPFYVAEIFTASSVEYNDRDGLSITIWKPETGEYTVSPPSP